MQNMFQGGFTPFAGRQVTLRGLPAMSAPAAAVPPTPVPQPMAAPHHAQQPAPPTRPGGYQLKKG